LHSVGSIGVGIPMSLSCTYCSTNSLIPVIGGSLGCGYEDWSFGKFMTCCLVETYWHYKGTCHLHLQAAAGFSETVWSFHQTMMFVRQAIELSAMFYSGKTRTSLLFSKLELQDSFYMTFTVHFNFTEY
jgi:hypothetical protein